jgi:nondiscriminating glutamyl-tRNA synthetase
MSEAFVTRFAPSPSGELHLGNVRTALFNLLLARHHGGRLLLRIEDTDAERTEEAHVAQLLGDLSWLGIHWDGGPERDGPGGPWRQSERASLYAPLYAQLESQQLAYPCYCTPVELNLSRLAQLSAGRPPRYAGTCRNLTAAERAARAAAGIRPTLRFRVPEGQRVAFDDLVHGPQSMASDEIGDFIIRREDGTAAFFFCNAVDDALMGVTQVLRGDDHLTNTPRQLLLLAALGLAAPRYGHLGLLTGADGAPLSKRNGALSARELRDAGYSALAVCNHLFRLGHSSPALGLLSLEQMAANFSEAHLQGSSAHFEISQLRHWQGEWVRALTPDAALAWLDPWLPATEPVERRAAFVAAIRPNLITAEEVYSWCNVAFGGPLEFEADALTEAQSAGPEFFRAVAASVGEAAQLGLMRAASGRTGAGFFRPLRAALTGRLHGPELAPLLSLMGPDCVRARLLAMIG